MKNRYGIGVDAGGTFLKATAATPEGKVLCSLSTPTRPDLGPKAFVASTAELVERIEKRLGGRSPGLCVAVAGDVDVQRGVLRRSPNLESYEGFPLRKALQNGLKRPVSLHNDANMAAWGAYAVELKRKLPKVLVLTMGTGVGGGAVLDGKLLTGATGTAAEFGHMRIYPNGYPCNCGAHGCLEAHAGTYGLRRTVGELLAEKKSTSRLRNKDFTPKDVADAANAGDNLAKEAWRRVGRALGLGVVNLVYTFNPDAIVFAGGLSRAGALYMDTVKATADAESFRGPFGHLKLLIAKRPDLGSVGAAVYALDA
ncbi:MAG: ROK family protein [Elusimicrobia bacterium]|nr:ROK family protein [Elusimicrobiota bacterium]